MPNWPLFTPSGTPKLRSVMAAQLPAICSSCDQPLSQPSPCSSVSTVRCVVPEREGELIARCPKYAGLTSSAHCRATGSLLAAR